MSAGGPKVFCTGAPKLLRLHQH